MECVACEMYCRVQFIEMYYFTDGSVLRLHRYECLDCDDTFLYDWATQEYVDEPRSNVVLDRTVYATR